MGKSQVHPGKKVTTLLLSIVFFTLSCGVVKVPVTVTHPPEIDVSKYQQVAIVDIKGNLGNTFYDELKYRLVEAGHLKVIDRDRLNAILREQNLSQSDLSDEKSRLKLGKMLSAAALIMGHYNGDYEEKITKDDPYQDKEGKTHQTFNREGKYTTQGFIDVIDVETGQIIKSKKLQSSASDTETETDKMPKGIDREVLTGKCISQDLNIFFRAISPWRERIMVPFEKDGKVKELEKGINMAKMGEMEEAIKIFYNAAQAAENNPNIGAISIARSYWNLGLALEYTWEFDRAIECFITANRFNPNDKYVREKVHVERLREERQRLIKQGIEE